MPEFRVYRQPIASRMKTENKEQEVYVHGFLKTMSGWAAVAALGVIMGIGTAPDLRAQAAGQEAAAQKPATPQKKVKDQIEYDLFNQVLKDQSANNPQKTITDLDTWAQKYPNSDYKDDRLYMYEDAYSKMNPPQPEKVVDYGTQLMNKGLDNVFTDPKQGPLQKLNALFEFTAAMGQMPNPTPEQIDLGKKAANELKQQATSYFTPQNKPANNTEAQWDQARKTLEAAADHTLLYLDVLPANQAMAKKDCATAEPLYVKALQDRPQSAYISYQLATAMVCMQAQHPELVPQAIYEFERAAVIDPTLGDPHNDPERLKKYADNAYVAVHGSTDGLDQLKDQVKQSPLPPADFKIQTKAEVAAAKEQQFEQGNPRLALWMKIKGALAAPDGDTYFTNSLKDSAVPQLRGVVVEGKPACRSREILVAVPLPDQPNNNTAEITLKVEPALTGKPEVGSEILWEGVPTAFTKDPFMLTMEVSDKTKLTVKTSPCAPAPVRRKKAAR